MNLTADDIRENRFKTRIMGYNPADVDAFMSTIADEFEASIKEVNSLRDEIRSLNADLQLYKGREESIKKTMMTAQKVCDDMKKNAERECQIMISEAGLKGEKFLTEANQRLSDAENNIAELKRQKVRFEESLRSMLATHFKLLDISKEEKADVTEARKI